MIREPSLAEFDLHIGDLVLDGFSPSDSRAIVAALEQELGRLLADGPAPFADTGASRPRQDLAVDRVDAGTIPHAPGASPRALGRSAARAIVRQLRSLSGGRDVAPARSARP